MLFLGGLNSILPYIIYLSLIWICLIIGFTGKIGGMVHILVPKVVHTDQTSLQPYDNKVIQYFEYSAKEKQNPEEIISVHEPGKMQIPVTTECNLYSSHDPFLNVLLLNANWFRGPPKALS